MLRWWHILRRHRKLAALMMRSTHSSGAMPERRDTKKIKCHRMSIRMSTVPELPRRAYCVAAGPLPGEIPAWWSGHRLCPLQTVLQLQGQGAHPGGRSRCTPALRMALLDQKRVSHLQVSAALRDASSPENASRCPRTCRVPTAAALIMGGPIAKRPRSAVSNSANARAVWRAGWKRKTMRWCVRCSHRTQS